MSGFAFATMQGFPCTVTSQAQQLMGGSVGDGVGVGMATVEGLPPVIVLAIVEEGIPNWRLRTIASFPSSAPTPISSQSKAIPC